MYKKVSLLIANSMMVREWLCKLQPSTQPIQIALGDRPCQGAIEKSGAMAKHIKCHPCPTLRLYHILSGRDAELKCEGMCL